MIETWSEFTTLKLKMSMTVCACLNTDRQLTWLFPYANSDPTLLNPNVARRIHLLMRQKFSPSLYWAHKCKWKRVGFEILLGKPNNMKQFSLRSPTGYKCGVGALQKSDKFPYPPNNKELLSRTCLVTGCTKKDRKLEINFYRQ